MDSLGAALLAGGDDAVDEKIALRGRRWADCNRRIGHFNVKRVAIGVGIDRNGCNSHPAGCFNDPTGDLAAVGNEDSLEHSGYKAR